MKTRPDCLQGPPVDPRIRPQRLPARESFPVFADVTGERSSRMIVETRGEVVTLGGIRELSAANAEVFRQGAHAAMNGQKVIEIDLSQTTVMDCAGLGALIALRNRARDRNARVHLLNPTIPVQGLLALMQVACGCGTSGGIPGLASRPPFIPATCSRPL